MKGANEGSHPKVALKGSKTKKTVLLEEEKVNSVLSYVGGMGY